MCYTGNCPFENLNGECSNPGKCYLVVLDDAYDYLYKEKFEEVYNENYNYLYKYYTKEEGLNPKKAHYLADKEAKEQAEKEAELYADNNCIDEALGILGL